MQGRSFLFEEGMTTEELTRTEDPLAQVVEQTPPEPVVESTTEEQAPDPTESIDNVLKGLGFSEAAAPAPGEGTEAALAGGKTYTEDDFEVRVKDEVRKRDQARLRDSEVSGIRTALTQRKVAVERHLQSKGVAVETIAPILEEFDRHHGQAAQVATNETWAKAESNMWTALYGQLPEAERKAFADRRVERHEKGEENMEAIVKDFHDTTRTLATKGRFTQAQVNEAKRDAQREVIKKLVAAGVPIPGYNAPEVPAGTANNSSGSRWRTKAEAQALFTQGKLPGGAQEMRRIRDDPTIEWGL